MVSVKGYGQLQIRKEAIKKFKTRVKPGETQTKTLERLIELDEKNENRKCPDATPGIIES